MEIQTDKIVGGSNGIEINFDTGEVVDKSDSNVVCANLVDGKLKDGNVDSIHWTGRLLSDSQGNPVMTWDGDVRLVPGRAVIIPSPNGTLFRCSVDDNGNWINVAIPTP